MTEIDQLIQKSYEDMTKGLSKERFSTLTVSLETEQTHRLLGQGHKKTAQAIRGNSHKEVAPYLGTCK